MKIGRKEITLDGPTYFIADIASNHDGDLERAKRLIYLAAEAGADAVKFQNFKAETIVSDYGFRKLGPMSHQADWKESVFETYKRCETPIEWTPELKATADKCDVDFLTTPYDIDSIPALAPYVCAWKVGSGDITYKQLIMKLASYGKPILLATGASTDEDINRALSWMNYNNVVLMQCNTNYTGAINNIDFVNLRVIPSWWGGGVIGFSDHTYGNVAVLGAIALAAKVIEKHFTDDNDREGPDHGFSMNPVTWEKMVSEARDLEAALGDGIKKVEQNEKETAILQRRAIRANKPLEAGHKISIADLAFLRPCPSDGLPPYRIEEVLGKVLKCSVEEGDCIRLGNLSKILL